MKNIWHDISPERITPEDFVAVVEISREAKKYELDKETGLIILDRILYTLLIILKTMDSYQEPTVTIRTL